MTIASFTHASTRSFIQRAATVLGCVCALGALGCSDEDDDTESTTAQNQARSGLSFFVTSSMQDGNLGGLEGADEICRNLATAVGAGNRTWRAYLSAENNGNPIHARDRIGQGPWFNAEGVQLAANLTELHTLTGNPALFLTETGERVNGQWNGSNGMDGNPPNTHDIMTGSDSQGMLLVNPDPMMGQSTCADWTSNTLTPGPQVGHSDGMGPMMNTSETRFTSWNGGHPAAGCSMAALQMRGGAGQFYCFAAD